MLIKEALLKENNNFNLLRIILASLVIMYHSLAIFPHSTFTDPVKKYFLVVSTGGLAVKVFFFLSGMLVTNSLIQKNSVFDFIFSRAKRILPAYFFVIITSCFLIGPIISNLNLYLYFKSEGLWSYLLNNLSFRTSFFLPGVFSESKYAFNGSIWTIPVEIKCYTLLISIYGLLRFFSIKLAITICFFAVALPLTPVRDVFFASGGDPAIYMLAPCFALGCTMSIFKDRIKLIATPFLMVLLLSLIVKNETAKSYLICFPFCILSIFIFTRKSIVKFRIRNDVSYGMYLWGFPVQQITYHYITDNVFLGCTLSFIISYFLGLASWIYIEKPFIKT